MNHKEAPEVVKNMPLELESAIGRESGHMKTSYKRYRFEFYKDNGEGLQCEQVPLKEERKKSKKIINFILGVIGNSVEIEYEVKEKGILYKFRKVIESGHVFFVDNRAEHFAFRVT